MSTFTQGDTAPALTGTVNADLTGATLEVHIRWRDGTTLNRAGVVVDGAAGTWSMAWQASDLSVTGTAHVEAQVTFSSGEIQTFPATEPIYVQGQIA